MSSPTSLAPIELLLPRDDALVRCVRRGHRRYVVEIDGTRGTVAEWAEAADIPISTLYDRLQRGERGRRLLRPSQGAGRAPLEITADGATRTLSAWSRRRGIPKTTISWRLRNGWSAEEAVGPREKDSDHVQPKSSSTSDASRSVPAVRYPAPTPNARGRRRR